MAETASNVMKRDIWQENVQTKIQCPQEVEIEETEVVEEAEAEEAVECAINAMKKATSLVNVQMNKATMVVKGLTKGKREMMEVQSEEMKVEAMTGKEETTTTGTTKMMLGQVAMLEETTMRAPVGITLDQMRKINNKINNGIIRKVLMMMEVVGENLINNQDGELINAF